MMPVEDKREIPVSLQCICKLKHDIRVESKVDLAKKEVEHCLGTPVTFLTVLPTLFRNHPFSLLDDKIVDRMTRLLYLGKAHAFQTELHNLGKLVKLCKNATYLREIYAIGVVTKDLINDIAMSLGAHDFHEADILSLDRYIRILPSVQIYSQALSSKEILTTIFMVPVQTLLEYATEVVKLPYVTFTKQYRSLAERLDRMEDGVKRGIADLIEHLASSPKRMPWLGLYKEHVGDYVDWAFSDFRTWGLHFIHKQEGKADPWLARSVLNLLGVDEGGRVLDPFCGSGTFIADAPLLNLNAIGVDINPLSTMIAKVKCSLTGLNLTDLKESLIRIEEETTKLPDSGTRPKPFMVELQEKDKERLSGKESIIIDLLSIKDSIDDVTNDDLTRDFLYTILSRSVVEVIEKQKRKYAAKDSFMKDAVDFYLYVLASQEMLRTLDVKAHGKCSIITANTHNLMALFDGRVDGIVTSPPYFDAIDYVGFSRLPTRVLGMGTVGDQLEYETIGSKRRFASDTDMWSMSDLLPESARTLFGQLLKAGRESKARIVLQYLLDMSDCMHEFFDVLNEKRRMIFVVGRYHNWKVGENDMIFDGSQVLSDIGESVGFVLEDRLAHNISKIEAGRRIREESIIIWRKE
jgi:SAM-dependent methyltransferase